MSDENTFKKFMDASKSFNIVKDSCFKIINPRNVSTEVEIDNIGQKGKTLFVFEGSRGPPNISQLKERFFLFNFYKVNFITKNYFYPYSDIRVFYYNLKAQRLIEYNNKGINIKTFSYKNTIELIEILRKL